jgi:hypothetical protein
MTVSASSSLKILSGLYVLGFFMVWLGVVLEGAEILTRRKHGKKRRSNVSEPWNDPPTEQKTPSWAHKSGDFGWLILVAGLAIEEFAHHKITGIKDGEIAVLTGNLRETTKIAGEANERAALANERSERMESTNLVLRIHVAELEAKLQWRTIDHTQQTNFIALIKPLAFKRELRVEAQETDEEARSYAKEIVSMFSEAGFNAILWPQVAVFKEEAERTPGVAFMFKNQESMPPEALGILTAFRSTIDTNILLLWYPTVLEPGSMSIRVNQKPRP